MEERRRFIRYGHEFEIDYSPKGDGVIYSQSISKNISRGGICIPVLSRLVRIGDSIKLDIYINNRRNPVTCMGKVVWIKEMNTIAGHLLLDAEAGIEFTDVNTRDLEKLLQAAQ